MKNSLPIAICFIAGLFMILDFSVSAPFIQTTSKSLQDWTVIVSAFALGIGGVSLIRLHGRNIVKRSSGWGNSVVLLLGLFFMIFRGILFGTQDSGYLFAFNNMLTPLGAACTHRWRSISRQRDTEPSGPGALRRGFYSERGSSCSWAELLWAMPSHPIYRKWPTG